MTELPPYMYVYVFTMYPRENGLLWWLSGKKKKKKKKNLPANVGDTGKMF